MSNIPFIDEREKCCNGYLAHPFAKLPTSPTLLLLGTELD
jgi:hypothetical protein